ncbi:MAG TPA: DUF4159 domain-containing protein [bacterium]|nr:DUF4159 domain-containing protein [bacterium]HPR86491.1 DUF4159 domain-containing protein [bacterium]
MRKSKRRSTILLLGALMLLPLLPAAGGVADFTIARLKYSGGGDWYNDPSILPNMLAFLGAHSTLAVAAEEVRLSLMDEELFAHPVLFMTGHGRISFSGAEAARLRAYLTGGGFLIADDDYGMDDHFRREIRKVFPDHELVELPFSHPIFQAPFSFPQGMPKTHEHDGGAPQAFALFHDGRMVLFYCFNSNISDGWADENVHHDPPEVREKALEMGMNIIVYALTH